VPVDVVRLDDRPHDRTTELVPTAMNVPAMPCETCALRLHIDEVSRGRWTISVGGVKRTVDVR
jgi:hypothetical protein